MDEPSIDAFDLVLDTVKTTDLEQAVGARRDELTFLNDVLSNPIFAELIQAQDALESTLQIPLNPVSCDCVQLVGEITDDLGIVAHQNAYAKELRNILRSPNFKALAEVHDDVGSKNYDIQYDASTITDIQIPMFGSMTLTASHSTHSLPQESVRMVGIAKKQDEALGITVKPSDGGLVVARILPGSLIEKQELLHVGDLIKEINGNEVSKPEDLQDIMRRAVGTVTFKIIPTLREQTQSAQVFLKAHFIYDPKRDNLIPCREAGLPFRPGDILQVVNRDDPNWWQARRVDQTSIDPRAIEQIIGEDNRPTTGLIPSLQLEEKRKAFVRPEYDYSHRSLLCGISKKKKKKMLYAVNSCSDLDRTDLQIYEEVARMPPFQRKCLVLLGAKGVGRRVLKQMLIKADKERFAAVIPHTTRPKLTGEPDGEAYFFTTEEQMLKDIANNKFLEYGQYDNHYYGTKFDSVRNVIHSGKMCILDISPQAAKSIKTPEFMPYIVFIAAPIVEIQRNMYEYARFKGKTDKLRGENDFRSTYDESQRIEKQYKQYFDETIVNDNMDEAYNKLRRAIEKISTKHQWVPVTWVY